MSNKEFLLITKAKDLVKHTLLMTNNTKRFPKKFRFEIVNRMQGIALDIFECIQSANELNINDPDALKERLYLQNKAITKCKTLSFFIELSFEEVDIKIDDRQCKTWTRHILDVQYMAVRWHTKDKERTRK